MTEFTEKDNELIADLIKAFQERIPSLQDLLTTIDSMITEARAPGGTLEKLVHSVKMRIKDPKHLEDKLYRKLRRSRETNIDVSERTSTAKIVSSPRLLMQHLQLDQIAVEKAIAKMREQDFYQKLIRRNIKTFNITRENLFSEINDLAGYRIMHLHPRQMEQINSAILQMIEDRNYELVEGPGARVWDLESKAYFESVGIDTIHTEKKLYSSVHYIVKTKRKIPFTCEIQVRTVADELWGEVDHTINYPHRLESIACTEEIKSLAHMTTSCNRLVDSIFASFKEWKTFEKTRTNHGNA